MNDYIYKLVLKSHLLVESNWTKKDNDIVNLHFKYLQDLQAKGMITLVGKTDGLDESTYGIVIFKAESYEKAKEIMDNDPAIKQKIMVGVLQKFNIALTKK